MSTKYLPPLIFLVASCGDGAPSVEYSTEPARFAVVRSDYQSTSIALLDAAGQTVDPAVFSSASAPPGLVAPLSGDVVLPSGTLGADGTFAVIDRYLTDVVTRLALPGGEVIGQVRVAPSTADFSTNPQDIVVVNETSAWVSRYSVDEDDVAGRGSDLLEVDLASYRQTGRRVSLASLTTTVSGDIPIYPRPSRMVRVGQTLVVGLDLASADFLEAGPGAVALVRLDDLSVTRFALPESLRSCGSVSAVPGVADRVVVACMGFPTLDAEPERIRTTSGVFSLRISASGVAEIVWSWRPEGAEPLAVSAVVPLDADRFVGVESGSTARGPDVAYVIDVASSAADPLLTAASPYSLGRAGWDPDTGRILLPERSAGHAGIHRILSISTGFELEGVVRFEDGPLPPAAISLLESN